MIVIQIMNVSNPNELKQKVIQYCTEDKLDFKEITIGSEDSTFYWNLNIGNMAIYCQKRYPDRRSKTTIHGS